MCNGFQTACKCLPCECYCVPDAGGSAACSLFRRRDSVLKRSRAAVCDKRSTRRGEKPFLCAVMPPYRSSETGEHEGYSARAHALVCGETGVTLPQRKDTFVLAADSMVALQTASCSAKLHVGVWVRRRSWLS